MRHGKYDETLIPLAAATFNLLNQCTL